MQKMTDTLTPTQMQKLNQVLTEVINEQKPNISNTNTNTILLEKFLTAKRVEGCSEKSIKYYKSTLDNVITKINKNIQNMDTDDIRTYLSEYQMSGKVTKVTIDNVRRIISSFFSWLEEEDYIMKSPARRIHKIKTGINVKEPYTDEELEMMRDSCKNKRDLAIIDILASTGMRVGELVNLNQADIDFEKRECIVLGKGNKERKTYFDARTKIHLQNYIKSRIDDNKALFVSLNGGHKRLNISGVEIRLRELGKSLNIDHVHPHKFRRTLATRAIDKGMPIEQVQILLGHTKIDTTLQYAMVSQNNVKIAHSKYIG